MQQASNIFSTCCFLSICPSGLPLAEGRMRGDWWPCLWLWWIFITGFPLKTLPHVDYLIHDWRMDEMRKLLLGTGVAYSFENSDSMPPKMTKKFPPFSSFYDFAQEEILTENWQRGMIYQLKKYWPLSKALPSDPKILLISALSQCQTMHWNTPG